jgi:AraC-like DNA-binding protein
MVNQKIEIQEKKEANYRRLVRPRMMDHLRDRILEQIVVKKRYRDSGYTARQLAADLQTNVRYVSAVVRVQFHTNYSTFINRYRIEEAMSILTDQRYAHLKIEDISDMVGFVHRQSFYLAFQKFAGMTPKAYRMQYELQLNKKLK